MVQQRCWNPCWSPLPEPLVAPKSSAEILLEPPFCAGTPAGTPLSAMEPLLKPPFVRFWSFSGIQHSVWTFTT